jgi:hypothetical protein
VTAEPLAVIGVKDGAAHVLSGVRGALILPGGEIAVADGATQEIRIFSGAGDHLTTFGGKGGGPGEFRGLSAIRHGPGGGICAWDSTLSRLTCFSATGAVVTSVEPDLSTVQRTFPAFLGVFADGSFILRDWMETRALRSAPEGERRDSVFYLHFDAQGRLLGRLTAGTGTETYFFNRDGVWSNAEVLFGRKTVNDLDADRLLVATNDSLDLRLYDSSGALRGSVRRAVAPRPVDDGMVARARAVLVQELEASEDKRPFRMDAPSTARLARAERDFIRRRPYRLTRPAFDEVHLDHAGRSWLGESILPDDSSRTWTILAPDLSPLATLELPADAELLDAGEDRVLLLTRDEWEVETVRLVHLERRE